MKNDRGTIKQLPIEQEKTLEVLWESEERYRTLFDRSPVGIFMYDTDLRITDCNDRFVDILQSNRESLLGLDMKTLEDRSVLPSLRIAVEGAEGIYEGLYSATTSPAKIWVALRSAPIFNKAGNVLSCVAIVEDITERKQAESKLLESEIKYRKIFENVQDVFYQVNLNGNIVEISPSIQRYSGYCREELIGKPIIDFYFYPEDRVKLLEEINKKGEVIDFEVRLKTKDERLVYTSVNAHLLFNEAGAPVGMEGTLRDVTERKRREREMEAILTLSRALRGATTPADMIPIILDHLLDLFKVTGTLIAIHDPVRGDAIIELARGDWVNMTGVRLPAGEDVIGHCISTAEPYLSSSVPCDDRLIRPDWIKDLHDFICIPLKARRKTIGALALGHKSKIQDAELCLLQAIGEITANAIDRATLHETTLEQLQQLSALHAIDMAISSSRDLKVTLNILLPYVTKHLDVDAAAVLLLNPYTQVLEYAAGDGFRSRAIEKMKVRMGECHEGRAALEQRKISILAGTGTDGPCEHMRLLEKGDAFKIMYVVPLVAKGQLKGVLEIFSRSELSYTKSWMGYLDALTAQAAIALDNAELFNSLQSSNTNLALAYDATIEGWSKALDMRDKETEGHCQRVADMTVRIATVMGVSESELVHVRRGALLHDIGKMGVPDSILLKPGPLTEEDWMIMRKHPVFAHEMLSPITFLSQALLIPYCHHEKWDGTGYPRGLKGDMIPLSARIFAVVDVWDALLSDRPYRPAWPQERVFQYLRDQAGIHFDPEVVRVFFRLYGEGDQQRS